MENPLVLVERDTSTSMVEKFHWNTRVYVLYQYFSINCLTFLISSGVCWWSGIQQFNRLQVTRFFVVLPRDGWHTHPVALLSAAPWLIDPSAHRICWIVMSAKWTTKRGCKRIHPSATKRSLQALRVFSKSWSIPVIKASSEMSATRGYSLYDSRFK